MDTCKHLFTYSSQMAELDTPEKLLANEGSIFYSLALEAGLVSNEAGK